MREREGGRLDRGVVRVDIVVGKGVFFLGFLEGLCVFVIVCF